MAELQVCGEVTDHVSQPFPPGTLAVSLRFMSQSGHGESPVGLRPCHLHLWAGPQVALNMCKA